jgi:predicted dehydrogenase
MLRLGVLGVGHLGKIHLRKIQSLSSEMELVTFFDPHMIRAKEAMEMTGIMPSHSVEHLFEQVDAVIIAAPTAHHFELAIKAARAFKHVFIEKPVCMNVQEARALIKMCREADVMAQVGHIERFNPAFQAALPLIHQPKLIEGVRNAVYHERGLDISVIMDVMIHDIDLVYRIAKAGVRRLGAAGYNMKSLSPDVALLRMEMDNGCVAHLSSSRVSEEACRVMKVYEQDYYLEIDFLHHRVKKVTSRVNQSPIIEEIEVARHDAIEMELLSFVHAVQKGGQSAVTLEDAARALEIVIAAEEKCAGSAVIERDENFVSFMQ